MPVEAVWAAMGSTQAVLMMLFGPSGRRAGEDEVHVVDRGELGLDVVLDFVYVFLPTVTSEGGSRPFSFVSNCVADMTSVNSSGLMAGLSMGETSSSGLSRFAVVRRSGEARMAACILTASSLLGARTAHIRGP